MCNSARHGTNEEIADAVRGLAGDNKGVNRGRRFAEAAVLAQPNQAVAANTDKQDQSRADAQKAFNAQLDDTNAKLAQQTTEMEKQAGLRGQALLEAQAQAAADKAELELKQQYDRTNAERESRHEEPLAPLTQAQIDATRKTHYDSVATPQAKIRSQQEDVQQPVSSLSNEASALQNQMQALSELGDANGVAKLGEQINVVNGELDDAIGKAIQFYGALTPGQNGTMAQLGLDPSQVQAAIAALQQQKAAADDVNLSFLGITTTTQTLRKSLAEDLTAAMDHFAQSIAKGVKPFTALKNAFLDFAATFLRQIAQMIIQALALKAVTTLLNFIAPGSGSFVAAAGPISGAGAATVAHSGGIVGSVSRSRSGPGLAEMIGTFGRRFHTGGMPGLSNDEVAAVLQRGEEVLSKDDPRNILNGGGKAAAPQPAPNLHFKNVNVIDSVDVMQHAVGDVAGQKVLLNFFRDNSSAVKVALGGT